MSFLPPVMAHSKYSINIFKLLKDWNERMDEKINEQTNKWLIRNAEIIPHCPPSDGFSFDETTLQS